MSRKYRLILTVSVILNVLLLGLSGGMLYKKWQWKQNHTAIAASDFSPEARNVVARHFRAARRDMGDEFERSRTKRNQLVKLLKAKKFDERAYDRTVKDLQKIQGELLVRKMEMLKDLALDLPEEERQKISPRFIKPYGPHAGKDKVPEENQ